MGLEAATYINQLDANNPLAGDPVNAGDDHIRLIKAAIKATFPNIAGAVTPTQTELNYVGGVTSPVQTQLDTLASAIAALQTGDINFQEIWDAIALKAPLDSPTFTTLAVLPSNTTIGTISATELSYLDGLTGPLQAQLDTKAPSASPTFTGTVTLPATTSIGNVSSTELGYLDGVTSALQTQLNGKAATAHTHAAGDVVSGTFADARISQSSVTQHQAQFSLGPTQVVPSGSTSSSTSFTISSSQREQLVSLTGGSPISVVIGDGHGFSQYESVAFERNSTSTVTFSTSGAQTLRSPGSRTTIPERYGVGVLTYMGSNAWLLSGV
jgi:hypothetical protein